MKEGPWRSFATRLNLDLNQARRATRKGNFQFPLQFLRLAYPRSVDTKAAGQGNEVRIDEVRSDNATFVPCSLIPQDVAEALVVEHDRDDSDAVLYGGSKLLYPVHEAAIAAD